MKISELQQGMVGVRFTATVEDIGPIKDVKTRYGTTVELASATISDDSGNAKLTLWADQINLVKPGDKVEIVNGIVKEWQGEMQISIGKQGEIKVLSD